MSFLAPRSLEGALEALAGGTWQIIAGGTDVYPALAAGHARPGPLLDIGRIAALSGIEAGEEGWRIGATTRWSEIARADLPPLFDGLRVAARTVGAVQIQNAGTIGGNLCNASPAADGIPALMALGAEVELVRLGGVRRLALEDFLLGPRNTALATGEIVTAVLVPRASAGARSVFLKLGARAYQVISIAMVAATAWPDGAGRVGGARVAVGACSPVACRLTGLEAVLTGAAPAAMAGRLGAGHLAGLSPIDDVRGTGGYRLAAAGELVTRALDELGEALA